MKKRLMMQAAAAAAAQQSSSEDDGSWCPATVPDDLSQLQDNLISEDQHGHLTSSINLTFVPTESAEEHNAQHQQAPSGADEQKYKWSTSLDSQQHEFNFETASPRENLYDINWRDQVKALTRSEAGAEGVFFVDTSLGAVVIKGSRSMASEAFSCLLGTKLGVLCPRWRIITTGGPEGKVMMKHLLDIDPSGRCRQLANQVHVLLKGYIPGVHFGELSTARAFGVFGPPGDPSASGLERLEELGRVLALDVLCNNGDRFPLIWDNRGNPGNTMLATGAGKVVSIDSQCTAISFADQLAAYLQKVEALVEAATVARNGDTESAPFMIVVEKIKEACGHDVGPAGAMAMQAGFLDIVARKEEIGITAPVLQGWIDTLAKIEPPLVGIETLSADFTMQVWEQFVEVLSM